MHTSGDKWRADLVVNASQRFWEKNSAAYHAHYRLRRRRRSVFWDGESELEDWMSSGDGRMDRNCN
jgi:hypothetical protein